MSSNSNIYKFNSLQIFLQKQKKKNKKIAYKFLI